MSSSETSDSNNTSCLSLNSVDIKRNPISSQLSGQDYLHFSAPGLKKSKRSKGKRDRETEKQQLQLVEADIIMALERDKF